MYTYDYDIILKILYKQTPKFLYEYDIPKVYVYEYEYNLFTAIYFKMGQQKLHQIISFKSIYTF